MLVPSHLDMEAIAIVKPPNSTARAFVDQVWYLGDKSGFTLSTTSLNTIADKEFTPELTVLK